MSVGVTKDMHSIEGVSCMDASQRRKDQQSSMKLQQIPISVKKDWFFLYIYMSLVSKHLDTESDTVIILLIGSIPLIEFDLT